MSNGRISMNKIREILRLREESGLSDRKIGRALNISRPVVAHYLADYKASGLAWDKIAAMSDEDLLKVFENKRSKESVKYQQLLGKFDYFVRELKKTGVTIGSLWEDYHKEHPDGYAKSQFCYYFQVWRNSCEVTMHLEHKAGEKSFVDFTGKKLTVYDRKTGVGRPVETMVAILGASQLTYAEATESQKKEDWIKANVNALNYFGGAPQAIVPDCLKSAVTNGNQYEADINPEYSDFARHYGSVILPARPNCPQDKALAENAVKIIYMRIFAPLRNSVFYSLEELNEALWERLEIHNNTMFQRMKVTRREFFNETEKSVLRPLPAEPYELRKFLSLKVQFNYHIAFSPDTHYYSVPWQNKGKQVTVIYTATYVEIYLKNIRIAYHQRDRRVNGYSTLKEHMHPDHQFYDGWSPQRFINWGEEFGVETRTMIEKVLESRQFPEQAYKACMGILHLGKRYGKERLNRACARGLQFGNYSYKSIKSILEKGLDSSPEESAAAPPQELPFHENIRGKEYFN